MSSTKPDRAFALVDCDNFYVSCERLFQPKLKNRPLIVLSNNDGCIVSRSAEVKALGIGMGVPFHQVKDLVKRAKVAVLSSNYTLYGDMSKRVMKTLQQLAAVVDIYSIDEAFLMLETSRVKEHGHLIRNTVIKHTGIPVTIGISGTKTLAKAAAEYAKKNETTGGVFNLTPEIRDSVLLKILTQEVWGIGVKTAEWLYQRGINSAFDLKNMRDESIRKRAGITGLRVVYELRGISCISLKPLMAPKKGITSSRSFGRYVTSLAELKESLATHATRAGEKLRADGSVAGLLSAFITTNVYSKTPQYANTATVSIIPRSNASHELIRLTMIAVEKIYKPGFRYIKAGVTLTNISPADQRQIDMFSLKEMDKEEKLYRAVDSINRDFGLKTLQHLSCGISREWGMRIDFRSSRYTTNWSELPVARVN